METIITISKIGSVIFVFVCFVIGWSMIISIYEDVSKILKILNERKEK